MSKVFFLQYCHFKSILYELHIQEFLITNEMRFILYWYSSWVLRSFLQINYWVFITFYLQRVVKLWVKDEIQNVLCHMDTFEVLNIKIAFDSLKWNFYSTFPSVEIISSLDKKLESIMIYAKHIVNFWIKSVWLYCFKKDLCIISEI